MSKICHIEITNKNSMPRVLREAVTAKNVGYQVEIYGFGDSCEIDGIKFYGFRFPKNRYDRIKNCDSQIIDRAIKSKPDIVQLHSPELLLYCRRLKKRNIKVIFDSHEFYKLQILRKRYIPKIIRPVISWMYDRFETWVCRRIDAIIFPCTVKGENLFDGKNKLIVKVENYPLEIVYEGHSLCKKRRTLVYAGGLTEDRGLDIMLKLAKELPCKLFLAGSCQMNDRNKLICDSVEYMGILDRKALFDLYDMCEIGLSLLLPEGQYGETDNLNTKIYEYMVAGLPVVFSNFEYAKNVNNKWHFGIGVNPLDFSEVKSAIKYLMDNPDIAKQMGENGKKAIFEEFNWKTQGEKLISLYRKLENFRNNHQH